MKQRFEQYKAEDFQVWKTLFERQVKNLSDKSCQEYLECLGQLNEELKADSIPRFEDLNVKLLNSTAWQIEVVPGLIPVEDFFVLLSQKKFCSSTWLRPMKQLDYLEEPDMFHDIFGHIPLFMNPGFAEFAFQMGALGVKHLDNQQILDELQRIYWFTIEFGLVNQNGIKLYGAGIMSSFGESNFVYSKKPKILPYNLEEVIRTSFCNSEIQTTYFMLRSFEELFDSIGEYEEMLTKRKKNLA